jgi:hypothetical protein
MSEVLTAPVPKIPTGAPYLEQRIFMASPLGLIGTTALLLIVLYGLYLLLAAAQGETPVRWTGHSLAFAGGAWPALVLSLLICAALGMQRYARLKDADDYERFAPIFSGGEETAHRLSAYAPNDAQLTRSTIVGILAGLVISTLVLVSEGMTVSAAKSGTIGWFIAAIVLLSVLFARGMELTRKSSRSFAITLRDELKIDLLRIDKLAVIGRSAARTAFIWIVVSAVACLFFVGGDISIVSIGTMLACAFMGIAIFVRAILGVHERIMTAKAAELEHVRCQIETTRAALLQDPHAATRLQGLLAYEHRVEQAQEWPFDQTTLVRVAASTLLITVPWFGQAVAGYFIEHLAH